MIDDLKAQPAASAVDFTAAGALVAGVKVAVTPTAPVTPAPVDPAPVSPAPVVAAPTTPPAAPASVPLYTHVGTGPIDATLWLPAGITGDGVQLYTFTGDTGTVATGISAEWTEYVAGCLIYRACRRSAS